MLKKSDCFVIVLLLFLNNIDESVNFIMYIEAEIPGEGVHSSYPPLRTTYINGFADEELNQ